MGTRDGELFHFGEYELDARRRNLSKNGTRVDISSKNFDLLYVLVENEGRVMTHDELLEAVWPGTFVEQSNLKKGISALRQLLDESPDEALYIKTVPRQGYVFVAPVARTSHEQTINFALPETSAAVEPLILPEPIVVRRKSYLVPIISIMLIAIAGIAAWKFLWNGSSKYPFDKVRIDKVTTDGNCYGKISSDGNFVVCMLRESERGMAIEVQQRATGDRRRIASFPSADIYSAMFSPDGNFIYFVLNDLVDREKLGVYKVSFLGGEPRMVVKNAASVRVSARGNLAITRSIEGGGTEVVIADSNGGDIRRAASFPSSVRLWDFRFSRNESSLLCAIRKQISETRNSFYVAEISIADGKESVVVPERDTLIANAEWMPDGRSLVLCIREKNADIRQIWQYFPSSGEMRRITNDNTSYRDVEVLRDGKTLAAVAETAQANIWIADDEKLDFRPATTGSQSIDNLFWTRDGRLGYATIENSAEVIRLMTDDGRTRERLNEGNNGYWLQPRLTGDGNGVTFNSTSDGPTQLWRVGIDGRNAVQLTISDTAIFNGIQLSDQSVVYKSQLPGEPFSLFRLSPDGSKKQLPIATIWKVSPDETKIASLFDNGGDKGVLISDVRTGEKIVSLPVKQQGVIDRIAWSHDSRSVAFVVSALGTSAIYQQPLDGGEAKKLTEFRYESILDLDWSYDGKKVAIVRGRSFKDPVVIKGDQD